MLELFHRFWVGKYTLILAACMACTFFSCDAAAGEKYKIDPQHTFTVFEYSHWGLSRQQGRFDRNSGLIEIDLEARNGSVLIEVDASSVSTGTNLFDVSLRSPRFFDTEKYPKIVFRSTNLVFSDSGKLIALDGDLTIKAVTKRVVLELSQFNCRFMPLYFASACGANGSAKILRSDFDLGKYTPFVSDEVTLLFSVEAIKE